MLDREGDGAAIPMHNNGLVALSRGSLYCEATGSGEALVLLHGFALDCRMWKHVLPGLSEFKLLRYDLRGFGRSADLDGHSQHASDLNDLLDVLNISSCHLLGFSFGGRVALDFYIKYSHRVSSLLLVSTIPIGFHRTQPSATMAQDLILAAQNNGVEAARAHLLKHDIFDRACRNQAVAADIKNMVSTYSGSHWLFAKNETVAEREIDMASITIPTLITIGEYDPIDVRRSAEYMHSKISNSELRVFDDVGHFACMEKPQDFCSAVRTFLRIAQRRRR
jgi:3-oxoadipate enol-lactonase